MSARAAWCLTDEARQRAEQATNGAAPRLEALRRQLTDAVTAVPASDPV